MCCAPTPGATNPVYVFLYTENVDATFNRAVAAGSKVDMPLTDQFLVTATGKSLTRLATSGASRSTLKTSLPRR